LFFGLARAIIDKPGVTAPGVSEEGKAMNTRPLIRCTVRLITLGVLALLLAGPAVNAAARPLRAVDPPAGRNPPPEMDPQIRAEMAASPDHTTGFLVLFREQADLSPAYGIHDWDLRGRYVYDALQATAQRSQARVRAWLQARGIAYRPFLADNSLFLTAGEPILDELAAFPEVAAFRANRSYALVTAIHGPDRAGPAGIAWNIAQVHADQVWSEFGVKGQGIVVADLSTGVQYNHPALYPNYKCGAGPHGDCWYDPTGLCPGGLPCDDLGVGTFDVGTMVGDDDPGLTYNVGMAPDAQWIACKACDYNGMCGDAALDACADWFLAPGGDPANRPHVVNMPWETVGCDPWYRTKLQVWRAAGIFPVAGAGNTGPSCGSVRAPGSYPEAFATGATDNADNIAPFSSRGPSCWGEIKPEVSAPGVNACSALPGNSWTCAWSGTDAASPHAAGLVALLWSAAPTLVGDLVGTEYIITSTAVCKTDLTCGGGTCYNSTYGGGRLDAYRAVLATQCSLHDLEFTWMPTVPAAGEVVDFEGVASGTMPISFSWSFGDGHYGSGPMPSHTYDAAGTYGVAMTATNACSTSWVTHDVVVVPACDPPAGAAFTWAPPVPPAGEPVHFTGTVASGSEPFTLTWDLGDGGTGSGPYVDHTYGAPGSYTVVMTASNCATATATAAHTLTVAAPPCDALEAVAVDGPALLLPGETGLYSATYSPPTATVPVLTWDNGTVGPSAAYSWTMPGHYTIAMTATNSCSEVRDTFIVEVCQRVEAVAIVGPAGLRVGEAGLYTATAAPITATAPVTFAWDNGTVGPSAVYSWTLPGNYAVAVTATNDCGVAAERLVVVVSPYRIYLPLVLRGS
jgi:PKD repeat protein